jgi:hypothetical protein
MVLRVLFARVLGAPLGVIVLSALLSLVAWQWLFDGASPSTCTDAGVSSASIIAVARWLLPAVLLGAAAYFLPRDFGANVSERCVMRCFPAPNNPYVRSDLREAASTSPA